MEMKKKLSMTLMVLAAFMALAMQSCSKNTGNDDWMTCRISWSTSVQDKGNLSDEQVEELENSLAGSETKQYESVKMAESGIELVANQLMSTIRLAMGQNPTVTLTVTIIITRLSDNQEICKWVIIYDKGNIINNKGGLH